MIRLTDVGIRKLEFGTKTYFLYNWDYLSIPSLENNDLVCCEYSVSAKVCILLYLEVYF